MFKKSGEVKQYKGFFARHTLAIATTTLIGTIVGAGVLGIPYAIAKVGFLYGFLLLVVIGLAFLFLHLLMGEVVLRTEGKHQLPGYAGQYLGPWGKRIMTFSLLLGVYGALTAYLIGEGTTLHAIFNVGNHFMFTIIFFVVVSYIIVKGVKATGKAELFLISLLFLIVVIIGIISFPDIDITHFRGFNVSHILLPYGIILFAYMGIPSIPEMQEVVGQKKYLLKKAIIIGSVLPIILYIIFTVIILGLVGLDQFELLQPNERIATVALSIYANPILGTFANIMAVLSMLTSFLTLGIALTGIYHLDYGISRWKALLMTLSLPLLIALLNLTTFLSVLEITGTITGGLVGILTVLMFWKAQKTGKRTPEYSLSSYKALGWMLILLFTVGILYQFLRLVV